MQNKLIRRWLVGLAAATGLVLLSLGAIAGTSELATLTAAERGLVALRQEHKNAQSGYWGKQRQYDSREEVLAAFASGELVDPDVEYIPKLLEYEATHRGEDVGINALMHVFSEAGRGGGREGIRFISARQAAERLKHYPESWLLPRAVGQACCYSLHSEPSIRTALQDLLGLSELSPHSREVIRFHLAKQALEINRYLPGKIKGLAKLEASDDEPPWPGAIEQVRQEIADLPSSEAAAAEAEIALETLRELAVDTQSPKLMKVECLDEKWNAVRAVEDPSRPRLAEIAAALLFKEEYLVVNASAPALEVRLLDGAEWRLADHRGKVVVIQFSFTGCGPCARMYPDLAELTEEHGDRLEILTLMRDETAEHAEAAVADGKMTWSIALDGKPGEVTTRWSVDGFPEVYVIGPEGLITAVGLRGEHLREEVERLLAAQG